MFKRFTAILLLVALVSANCSRFFIYAGFEMNQKYIAQNLCINKNKPWLHCNGKCYFMRKIKEAQENEKKQEQADQKYHYQEEALPRVLEYASVKFEEPPGKITYPRTVTPQPVQRSSSILLPPKIA